MTLTPNEQRQRLLNDLQSIQNLLNKTNLMDSNNPTTNEHNEQEIIPILKTVHEMVEMIPTLTQQAEPQTQVDDEQEADAEDASASNIQDTPYLPKDMIERLASQASAISEKIRNMEASSSKETDLDEAKQTEVEEDEQENTAFKYVSEEQKQRIINELMDDMLPILMKQLRAKLHALNSER